MFHSRGQKRNARKLCAQEFERVFGSDPDTMFSYLNKTAPVQIAKFEARKFRYTDPSLYRVIINGLRRYTVFNPVSVVLYVAIKSEREGKRQKYVDMFMILETLFESTKFTVDVLYHRSLWQTLKRDTLSDAEITC